MTRVEGRIQAIRGGQLNSSEWGTRMSGTGVLADQIAQLFRVHARKLGLHQKLPEYDRTLFTPPLKQGQKRLF